MADSEEQNNHDAPRYAADMYAVPPPNADVGETPATTTPTAAETSTAPTLPVGGGSGLPAATVVQTQAQSQQTSSSSSSSEQPDKANFVDKESRKLFVGGLAMETDEARLRQYFENKVGPVEEVLLMRDSLTGKSRCFSFVTFVKLEDTLRTIDMGDHFIDEKRVYMERARPQHLERDQAILPTKVFVGNLSKEVTRESLSGYFASFGAVAEVQIVLDRETNEPRGFGFITFENEDGVNKVMKALPLTFDGKQLEIRRATPRRADSARAAYGAGYPPAGGYPYPRGAPVDYYGYPASGARSGYGSAASYYGGYDRSGRAAAAAAAAYAAYPAYGYGYGGGYGAYGYGAGYDAAGYAAYGGGGSSGSSGSGGAAAGYGDDRYGGGPVRGGPSSSRGGDRYSPYRR